MDNFPAKTKPVIHVTQSDILFALSSILLSGVGMLEQNELGQIIESYRKKGTVTLKEYETIKTMGN